MRQTPCAVGGGLTLHLVDARNAERIAVTLLDWAHKMAEIANSPSGIAALRAVFKYISLVSDPLPSQDLVRTVDRLAPPIKELLMTPAQQWIREGEERGKLEGKLETLRLLLSSKFGDVPESVQIRLQEGTDAELTRWIRRVLTAASLDEVFDS